MPSLHFNNQSPTHYLCKNKNQSQSKISLRARTFVVQVPGFKIKSHSFSWGKTQDLQQNQIGLKEVAFLQEALKLKRKAKNSQNQNWKWTKSKVLKTITSKLLMKTIIKKQLQKKINKKWKKTTNKDKKTSTHKNKKTSHNLGLHNKNKSYSTKATTPITYPPSSYQTNDPPIERIPFNLSFQTLILRKHLIICANRVILGVVRRLTKLHNQLI